jgi:hypothetical protein
VRACRRASRSLVVVVVADRYSRWDTAAASRSR